MHVFQPFPLHVNCTLTYELMVHFTKKYISNCVLQTWSLEGHGNYLETFWLRALSVQEGEVKVRGVGSSIEYLTFQHVALALSSTTRKYHEQIWQS